MTASETWETIADIKLLGYLLPDWNGYGAEPINPEIIEAAVAYFHRHAERIDTPPKVTPMTGGRLQLEWVAGDKELEIEFDSPATIHYLASCDGYDSDEDIISIDDDAQSRRGFDWLFGRLGPML